MLKPVSTQAELHGWFAMARHTYAVIDSQAVPQVESMLSNAGAPEWGRLRRGGGVAQDNVAWCVRLTPDLELSRWLIAGEATHLEDWGVLAASDAPFRVVRDHFRSLMEAQLPNRERIALRWYKPQVMRTLLPLCSQTQLGAFFGPVGAFATMQLGMWTRLQVLDSQLDARPLGSDGGAA